MDENLFPVNWETFHFLRPRLLWLLAPLVFLVLTGLLSLRDDIRWKTMIAPHLRNYVITSGSAWKKVMMYLVLLLAGITGVIGVAGPAWKQVQVPGQTLETPFVVLLQLSSSMQLNDIQPSRLERAKFKLNDLVKADPRARMALIGYAGSAHTIVPLTSDYKIITSHLDGLTPSVMPRQGNNLGEALARADSVLKVTTAPGSVLLITDHVTEEQQQLISGYVMHSPHRLFIMPMNTTDLDRSVISRLDAIDSVDVYPLTLDNSDVARMAEVVRENLEFTEAPEDKKDQWQDAGWILAIPLAFVVLLWFRRGWVLMLLLAFTSCQGVESFDDLWYSREYQAQRLSNEGNYKDAAELYTDPVRKGVAWYKAGEYEKAAEAFESDTTALGSYDRGLALLKMGDMGNARIAFQDAIERDPGMGDARENLEQVNKLLQAQSEVNLSDAQEAPEEQGAAQNKQNDSMEDLSGGGQEATKKDMEKSRNEETVTTDIRKGKELDEVPDDIQASMQKDNSKILMRKVDDDPSLFLKRKFEFQLKKREGGNE